MSEIPLNFYYERSKRVVGRMRNGAYVPHLLEKHLAHSIHREHGIHIPQHLITEAIYDIPISLFPDAQEFMTRVGQNGSIIPLIFTQGEVGVHGFQNWKVERSCLPHYVNPQALELLEAHRISFVYGGYNKCTFELIEPLISFIQQANIPQTVYVDDSAENIVKVVELFHGFGKPIDAYWLNRDNEPIIPKFEPMTVINSLGEIDVNAYTSALAMVDYDGTLVDRKSVRYSLKKSVLTKIENYLEAM